VKLELTTRSFSDKSRQVIIDGLTQIAAGITVSANLPPDRAATVTVLDNESTPVEYNDPALSGQVRDVLVKTFGAERVLPVEKAMGSEDVGVFGMSPDLKRSEIPVAYFRLGAMDPEKFAAAKAAGKRLPGAHTSRFEPTPRLTLETGVTAMTAVATALLQ
jgi:metal-dependent amidase/aminoacylase/carboxypeptidase family protein